MDKIIRMPKEYKFKIEVPTENEVDHTCLTESFIKCSVYKGSRLVEYGFFIIEADSYHEYNSTMSYNKAKCHIQGTTSIWCLLDSICLHPSELSIAELGFSSQAKDRLVAMFAELYDYIS